MTTDHDPFDVLIAADPARGMPRFDTRSERGRAVLARALESPARTRRIRRRPGPRFLAVVVGVGAIGAAAAAYVNSREPSRTQLVNCFETASGEGEVFVIGIDRHNAVDQCWRLWTGGRFAPTPTPPRLVACVAKGQVRVYPGGPEVCARLRMPLAPDDVRTDPKVADLADRLAEITVVDRCLSPLEARRLAEDAVDEAGLDWDVRVSEDATRCTAYSIEEPDREVVVVPAPPPGR